MLQHYRNPYAPITVDLREIDFVQALTSIDSPTFGNYYQSAINAGYTPSYARVISRYFPPQRIKDTNRKLQIPQVQSCVRIMREEIKEREQREKEGEFVEIIPTKSELKRLNARQKKFDNTVLRAIRSLLSDDI
jgi:phage terminase small subunit